MSESVKKGKFVAIFFSVNVLSYRGCICHSILVGITFILILFVKNKRGGVLKRQNLLSMTKVVRCQYLSRFRHYNQMGSLLVDTPLGVWPVFRT